MSNEKYDSEFCCPNCKSTLRSDGSRIYSIENRMNDTIRHLESQIETWKEAFKSLANSILEKVGER